MEETVLNKNTEEQQDTNVQDGTNTQETNTSIISDDVLQGMTVLHQEIFPNIGKVEKEDLQVEEKANEEQEMPAEESPVAEAEKPAKEEVKFEVSESDIDDEVDEDDEDDEIDSEEEKDFEKLIETFTTEQLVEKLEELVESEDIPHIKPKVASIKSLYLVLASKEQEKKLSDKQDDDEQQDEQDEKEVVAADENIITDELKARFDEAFNKYRSNRIKYNEKLEEQKKENLKLKNEILESLRQLIESEETLKKTYDEFKELQEKWKEIGPVPRASVSELWKNYHFLIEKFFDKVKINKELKDLDLKKNLEFKIALCEKAEDLLLSQSITRSFKELQNLHEEWKNIGPVPQDKSDEIWDRFKMASDKINARRKEHFEAMRSELEANYAAKVVLCQKAEEVVAKEYKSHKEWTDATNEVNEYFKLWRGVGRVPNKVNEEIWNRFKSQLDLFYENKKVFYDKIREEQQNNYNKKLNLVLQAENLSTSTDWKSTTRELIDLQKEWKTIGPVPRKHNEKIWKRFRAACDKFFDAKQAYYKQKTGSEEENLALKNELLKELTELKDNLKNPDSFEKLKDIQRRWMEIGFVPIKQKDKIQSQYKQLLDFLYDHFRVDNFEYNKTNFKEKLHKIKDQPQADRIISREKSALMHKIEKLREEILLWENNIGFFANSKQSNLYRDEYEKKISKGKAELELLEEQLKILDRTLRAEKKQQ